MTEETIARGAAEPSTFGHYRVVRKLAEGGMGEVFLAEDTRLRRSAAVKVISRDLARDPERKRRFIGEAHAASKLNHPHIAVIYDIGETADGDSFIGMEYVDGQTLAAAMRDGVPFERLLGYAIQTVDAVAEAHRHGVVHRDLKPQNVMITSRHMVKVLDFGLAKVTSAVSADQSTKNVTESGVILGTVAYMSPEQARGRPVDHRSDIFSLGVILYQMATGHLPFSGESAFQTLEKLVREDPVPLTKRNPSLPPQIDRIVSKCLEKERERRYSSADELQLDLRSVHSALTAGDSVATARAIPIRRRRGVSVALIAIIAAGLAAVTILARRSARPDPSAPAPTASPNPSRVGQARAVAVLPFKSLSADAESESFADGMAVELISALASVKGLRVASRTSSFAFKGAAMDVREVAEKLRVGAVVEGTIRTAGDRIRVTVQLVDAGDGYQVWSQSFDRKLTDVFAIQDEIARAVAERVRGEAPAGVTKPPTANLEAYRTFVLGRHLAGKNSIDNLRRAIASLDDALRLDPGMAAAHIELAQAYRLLVGRTGISPEEGFPKAIAAAERALELDSGLDAAHAALADIYSTQLRWADAERHIQQAIALRPDSPEAHRSHGRLLLSLGRLDDSVRAARKAYELNAANAGNLGRALYHARAFPEALPFLQAALAETPESAVVQFYIGMTLARLDRFPEAVAAMNRAIELAGDHRWRTHLAHVFALAGERKKAEDLLEDVIAKTPAVDQPRFDFAAIYAALGERERALTWLESAYEVKPSDLAEVKAEPDFTALRSEPRFKSLLQRLGLPDD